MMGRNVERDYFEDGVPTRRPGDGLDGVRQPAIPSPLAPTSHESIGTPVEPIVVNESDLSQAGLAVKAAERALSQEAAVVMVAKEAQEAATIRYSRGLR